MKLSLTLYLGVLAAILGPAQGFSFQDSLPDGSKLEVCLNNTAYFNWSFQKGIREVVKYDKFIRKRKYVADTVQKPMVFEVGPRFVYTPPRIAIKNVKVSDTGNYTLRVTVFSITTRKNTLHQSTASLTVLAPPVLASDTVEGGLVTGLPVIKGIERVWHLRLTCGRFQYLGHPAVTVVWKHPSGKEEMSSGYDKQNKVFYLDVPEPVREGEYTCKIYQNPTFKCVPKDSSLHMSAIVNVEEVQARLTMLETKVTHLLNEKAEPSRVKPVNSTAAHRYRQHHHHLHH